MSLTKLGNYLKLLDNRNINSEYGIDDVRGINNLKKMMPTKADMTGRKFDKFYIVYPNQFVFNHRTSRNGDKFSITYNYDNRPYIFTEDYVVFEIVDTSLLLPEWLYMYFCRPEFDRYVITNSWGSSTEFFNWEDICDIEISLPPLSVQQKYVNIYNAMLENQRCYERGLEDLKLVCDAYIENLRKKIKPERIGKFIAQKNKRNSDNSISHVVGLSTKKEFREAQSRVNRSELSNYKIVEPLEIAFVPTTDTWKVLAFAVNSFGEDVVVSPIYEVFCVDKNYVLPHYLAMWLSRKEFDRYARFNSWGSARENFSFEDMCDVKIPIPDIQVQKAIADIYNRLPRKLIFLLYKSMKK